MVKPVGIELQRKYAPLAFKGFWVVWPGLQRDLLVGWARTPWESLGKALIGLGRADLWLVQQVAGGHFFANEHPFVFVISFDYLARGPRRCTAGGLALAYSVDQLCMDF